MPSSDRRAGRAHPHRRPGGPRGRHDARQVQLGGRRAHARRRRSTPRSTTSNSGGRKHAWLRWPIVRGVVALVETLSLAMKAFAISATLARARPRRSSSPARRSAFTMVLGVGARGRALHRAARDRSRTCSSAGSGRSRSCGTSSTACCACVVLLRLHLGDQPHEGHPARVRVPRRRAQDDPRLRARPAARARAHPALRARCTCAAARRSCSWSWSSRIVVFSLVPVRLIAAESRHRPTRSR